MAVPKHENMMNIICATNTLMLNYCINEDPPITEQPSKTSYEHERGGGRRGGRMGRKNTKL